MGTGVGQTSSLILLKLQQTCYGRVIPSVFSLYEYKKDLILYHLDHNA